MARGGRQDGRMARRGRMLSFFWGRCMILTRLGIGRGVILWWMGWGCVWVGLWHVVVGLVCGGVGILLINYYCWSLGNEI